VIFNIGSEHEARSAIMAKPYNLQIIVMHRSELRGTLSDIRGKIPDHIFLFEILLQINMLYILGV